MNNIQQNLNLYTSEPLKFTVEGFPWESPDQKQGYLALMSYLKSKTGQMPVNVIVPLAFFIQKDIDAHDYWRELVGTQISDLQDQIKLLQDTKSIDRIHFVDTPGDEKVSDLGNRLNTIASYVTEQMKLISDRVEEVDKGVKSIFRIFEVSAQLINRKIRNRTKRRYKKREKNE